MIQCCCTERFGSDHRKESAIVAVLPLTAGVLGVAGVDATTRNAATVVAVRVQRLFLVFQQSLYYKLFAMRIFFFILYLMKYHVLYAMRMCI
jgi:uncharacterized membrane protein YtjA (UPF0391 family)